MATRRLIVAVAGPSGVGKDALLREGLSNWPGSHLFSPVATWTTRSPRANEVPAQDYTFVTGDAFRAAVARDEFLEHTETHGNSYGTPKATLESIWASKRIPLLDLDVKGVFRVYDQGECGLRAVFVRPPSISELEKRLLARATETREQVGMRVKRGREEIEIAAKRPEVWSTIITNDVFLDAVVDLRAFLRKVAEEKS
jgi:guanylate kinase